MSNNMKYWHICPPEIFPLIIKEGIKLNDDKIFLFSKKEYSVYIAIDQCFLKEFALFEISGIDESRLIKDEVAERSREYQWIYDRDIEQSKIKFMGCFTVR